MLNAPDRSRENRQVSEFVSSRHALSAEMTVEDVEAWFHARPEVESATVLTSGGLAPVGMVFRRRFLQQLAGRFGHALYGHRPISDIAETDFLTVPAEMGLREIAARLSDRANGHFYDDMAVAFSDGTYGTAPVRALLEALHHASAQLHEDLLSTREQNRQLRLQAEARWDLISSLSHELKTPLATILGYAELAEVIAGDVNLVRQHLGKISSATGELVGYVNSVLEMARAAAGRLELSPERFDLRLEIEAAAAQCEILVRGRSIRVSYLVPPEPVWVFLDRRKMRQVLVNLVGNAAKFTHAGTISVRLGHAERATLSVCDTGPGISDEMLPSLFQRFERVGDRTVDGSGLGLTIVKALVEAQGGTVGVKSALGAGTTFFVHLPLFPEATE